MRRRRSLCTQIVAEKFRDILEEKSGGLVTVKVYSSGQLGGEKETIEGEIIGTVDMGHCPEFINGPLGRADGLLSTYRSCIGTSITPSRS